MTSPTTMPEATTAPAWTIDAGGILRLDLGNGRKAAVAYRNDLACCVWTTWAKGAIAQGDAWTEADACAAAERWLEDHP